MRTEEEAHRHADRRRHQPAPVDAIAPAVADLGKRHASYGVKPEHYQTVGAALLWTLEQGLGPEFTPLVREAWTSAYLLLAEMMQSGAAAA